MREDLISYVLGELDASARERIEQELIGDAALRAEVERIRCCIAGDVPTDESEAPLLPRGLADRTTEQIVASSDGDSSPSGLRARDDYAAWACNFTMVDMMVALAMIVAVGSMLTPALNVSRDTSQRLACQNNLRELGVAMNQYAGAHGGFMPLVSPNEHAGVFSIRLAASDVINREDLSRLLVCVASPLGEDLRASGTTIEIPTVEEYQASRGERRLEIRRTSGGSYAYQIGYVENGYYFPTLSHEHSLMPVLSDAPNVAAGREVGANHGGAIINTLFQDGSVRVLQSCVVARNHDHLYLNDDGHPAAGSTWNDAVMSSSFALPGVPNTIIPESIRAKFFEF